MKIAFDMATGAAVYRTALVERYKPAGIELFFPADGNVLAAAASETGANPDDLAIWAAPDLATARQFASLALDQIQATMENGVVTAVQEVTPPTTYLHVTVSGGDGDVPPGIRNDGQDSLQVNVALRAGEDPASAVVPLDGAWRIIVRDDTGAIYDVVKVQLTAGQASIAYTSDQRPAACRLLESDFISVEYAGQEYQVRLVGDTNFKVFREL